jgi:hypothetical protein
MFVGDEVMLDLSFGTAHARLADLTQGGLLRDTSQQAYGAAAAGLVRVGPAGLSRLVRVQARELSGTEDSAGLAIRWEATGPGGALFPVLDADIRLIPAGERATLLTLAGTYRPPLGSLGGALDRAILHRVAAATMRNFIDRLATALTGRAGLPVTGPASSAPLPEPPELN